MNINWSLLGAPVDVGAHFQEGMQRGRAMRMQGQQDSALAALATDPTNESALAGLTAVNPQLGMQVRQSALQTQQMQTRQRIGQQAASGDLSAARATALQSGDIDYAQKLGQMSEDQRKAVAETAGRLVPIYEDLSKLPYEQRKPALMSIASRLVAHGVPENFIAEYDPSDTNLQADIRLGKKALNPTSMQQNYEYLQDIDPSLAEDYLRRQTSEPPMIASNGDGTFTIIPRSATQAPAAAAPRSSVPPTGRNEAELRKQAKDAIAAGADPAKVNARLAEMLKGGAAPATGSATFRP